VRLLAPALAGALLLFLGACAQQGPRVFSSPEEAVTAAVDLVGTGDHQAIEEIFGPGAMEVFSSGDETADRDDARRVKAMIQEKLAFEDRGDGRKVALLGEVGWPFPVPLVQEGGGWRFDLEAGREELLNRRVGRNELFTLATLHAIVDAQREYASKGRDGNPPAYARHILSEPGTHNGLFWPEEPGEAESPLGPLVAEATAEGYRTSKKGSPTAYHGYYYRILTKQGPSAPGGAREYFDGDGNMTGGFAALAWPATHGNSGIMTFQVNQLGIVFQKDLGPETAEKVASVQAFDPDRTWEPTAD
jgi:hypothetical protein